MRMAENESLFVRDLIKRLRVHGFTCGSIPAVPIHGLMAFEFI